MPSHHSRPLSPKIISGTLFLILPLPAVITLFSYHHSPMYYITIRTKCARCENSYNYTCGLLTVSKSELISKEIRDKPISTIYRRGKGKHQTSSMKGLQRYLHSLLRLFLQSHCCLSLSLDLKQTRREILIKHVSYNHSNLFFFFGRYLTLKNGLLKNCQ